MARPQRQALTNVGGRVESWGDPAFRFPLVAALEAASRADAEDEAGIAATASADAAEGERAEVEPPRRRDALTHGFHAYPARMHPAIAQVLLRELSLGPGSRVLDPFCGSGTVAVEAMLAGWQSHNGDLDPLALRIARIKTRRTDAATRARFVDLLEAVGEASLERVRGRVDIRAELSAAERAWYDVHVLKELAGLLAELRSVRETKQREALELVFSAIVVKFSRQRSDTAAREQVKRIRKGLVTEFFVRKGLELAERWAALADALPEQHSPPRFLLSDARRLPQTFAGEYRCDLVLCSPPYGGTYDYAHHHARRRAWLGVSTGDLEAREIGARRRYSRAGQSGRARWDAELLDVLVALRELMRDEALMVLLIGDADLGGERVPADQQIQRLAGEAELELVARASQPRADWHGGRPRGEHLLALRARG